MVLHTPPEAADSADDMIALFGTADAAEGIQSFMSVVEARFQGT